MTYITSSTSVWLDSSLDTSVTAPLSSTLLLSVTDVSAGAILFTGSATDSFVFMVAVFIPFGTSELLLAKSPLASRSITHSTNIPTTIIATTLAVFPEALRETLFLLLSIYCTAQAVTFRLLLQEHTCTPANKAQVHKHIIIFFIINVNDSLITILSHFTLQALFLRYLPYLHRYFDIIAK